RGIAVVIGDQDSQADARQGVLRAAELWNFDSGLAHGQSHDEFAATPRPFTLCAHGASMERDDPLDQRKTHTEPALRPVTDTIGLHEHREESRHHLAGYA